MKRLILVLVIPLILIMGCTSEVSDEEFPKNPHIKGEVISINEQAKRFYVEGEIEEGILYDKAHITVNEETVVYVFEEGRGEIAIFSMIEEGDTVEVWFVGPVAESYPVQAIAGKVFIYKNYTRY